MIKRSLWILATAAFLTACSSGVKLNDIPVEDKNASAASSPAADTNAAPSPVPTAAQSSVATVVGGKAGSQGVAPAGVNVVYFDYDSFTLLPEARAVLERNAAHLQSNKQFKVQLEGHTDERGGREYNLALGERRANGVLNFLIVNGAARSQIEVVSYGEERPAQTGQNDAAYQQNRRVEISGI